MNILKALAPIAAAAAMLSAPMAANAGLIVQITDGITSKTIVDNDASDALALLNGAIAYTGAFKTWELTGAFGTSVTDPFEMHLGGQVMGNGGDGVLTIKVTQTDLVAGPSAMRFAVDGGGSGALGSTASWAAYVDDSNTAFGTATAVASSSGYATSLGSYAATLSGLYSATIVATFDFSKITSSRIVGASMDVNMIPEPTSLALTGLALLGLGAIRRRKA